jgi:hypothetical protein
VQAMVLFRSWVSSSSNNVASGTPTTPSVITMMPEQKDHTLSVTTCYCSISFTLSLLKFA